ncbi:MAG: rRNA (guanine966-N2)-methyltransferase [Patescibacteria group bacterium]|nr:rRNA (guanine966-N2)-methyltransferase [Patescibacteria group bacterium]
MKLRIIAGELKGRSIDVPRKFSAHPMGERIRSALFNSLAGGMQDASVLDAFGGSGACGLEALSRGASNVLILEKDRSVFRYLNKNIKGLNLDEDERIHISKAPTLNYLKTEKNLSFDIIICDPPYELAEKMKAEDDNQLFKTLNILATKLNKNGVLILSWPEKTDLPNISNLKLNKEKTYAGARLAWYV